MLLPAARGPVALLLHRGHGATHLDLVLGRGSACPTVSIGLPGRLQARPMTLRSLACLLSRRPLPCTVGPAHRRRWLTAGGHASSGRGHATLLMRAAAYWRPILGGSRIVMLGLTLDIRQGLAVVSSSSRVTLR